MELSLVDPLRVLSQVGILVVLGVEGRGEGSLAFEGCCLGLMLLRREGIDVVVFFLRVVGREGVFVRGQGYFFFLFRWFY